MYLGFKHKCWKVNQTALLFWQLKANFFFHFPICEVTLKVWHRVKSVFNEMGRWVSSAEGFSLLSWCQRTEMWAEAGAGIWSALLSLQRAIFSKATVGPSCCGPGPSADWQVTHAPAGCWRFWQRHTEPSANCGRLSSFVMSQVATVCLRLNVRLISSDTRSWH